MSPYRAHGLTRDEAKRLAARLLDRAMRAGGITNKALAEALQVTGARIHRLRSDDPAHQDVVPTVADLLLVDDALATHVLSGLRAERRRLYGVRDELPLTPVALGTVRAAAALTHAVAAALEQSSELVGPALPRIEEALRELEPEVERLAAALRREARS